MKLPVDDLLPDILKALCNSKHLVIEAPPGAGKTTRVPPALLEFGDVVVLEPRRLAARMAARRVAFEMGERAGETVGYQVRFEDGCLPIRSCAGPRWWCWTNFTNGIWTPIWRWHWSIRCR
jgi:ATP-dependent helicase HrpB